MGGWVVILESEHKDSFMKAIWRECNTVQKRGKGHEIYYVTVGFSCAEENKQQLRR